MSTTVKGNRKQKALSQKQNLHPISATPAGIPAPELLRFLELSIGGGTDAYLLKLALRDARTDSIAQTSEKLLIQLKRLEQTIPAPVMPEAKKQEVGTAAKIKPLNGMVTVPKSVLFTSGYWVGLKFTVIIDSISDAKCPQTMLMKYLSIQRLNQDTVLFWSPLDKDTAFTLEFSDIELAFAVTTSRLYLGQEFNAEILSTDAKTVELRLVEKLPPSAD